MKRDSDGFTLVELLVSVALFGILMALIASVYTMTRYGYETLQSSLEVQQNLRAALYYLGREIRMAGYNGKNPVNRYGAGIVKAEADVLAFTFLADDDSVDNDGDDNVDEPGELARIEYCLYDAYRDGDTDLGRVPDNKHMIKRAIAENIDRVEFLYTLADGRETCTPLKKDYGSITMIRVTLLARSEKRSKRSIHKIRYETPGGNTWEVRGDYFRRMMTLSVVCRNMTVR